MAFERPTVESQHSSAGNERSNPPSRMVATLVLIPTVPMLLVSVAALALFYLAPTRFGNLIARLPGETFIRTALVFAPATLFAIVVLAALYAMEGPEEKALRLEAGAGEKRAGLFRVGGREWLGGSRAAQLVLIPAVPALLFSTALWALSFVSPGRFERLIEPLPGDRYLRPLVGAVPFLLFLLVLVASFFALSKEERAEQQTATERLMGFAVRALLVSSIPALLLSLGAFALSALSPTAYERLIDRLPYEEFVRLALVFAPAVLLAIVLLSILYLRQPRLGAQVRQVLQRVSSPPPQKLQALRSQAATWVLIGGLTLAAVMGLGLLGTGFYLVFR